MGELDVVLLSFSSLSSPVCTNVWNKSKWGLSTSTRS